MMKQQVEEAVDYALTNGLIKYNTQFKLTHAPFCLSPFAISSDTVRFLEEATPVFNELMIKVGSDRDFLKEHLSPVARTDEFIRRLLKLYEESEIGHHLQISRNDFLLSKSDSGIITPKQVEFNTISNSFLYLTQKMYALHRYMENYCMCKGKLSENKTLDESVGVMADMVKMYGVQNACVLMVVQQNEQNLFDQRGVEYLLRENYGIMTLRKTLDEIAETGKLKNGHLTIDGNTIALTYFRAGYTPNDFTAESAWKGRELIENSSTIKCPSVGMQLAGAKKIQQVLSTKDHLKRYFPPETAEILKTTFVGMYDLNEEVNGTTAAKLAEETPGRYVLKPQREGGGNNLYDAEMVAKIQSMSQEEAKAYILMERIETPLESSILVVDRFAEETSTVSEIGRYGACFFDGKEITLNRDLGYLVRTKSADQNEGGVCAGYACLNSLCVID